MDVRWGKKAIGVQESEHGVRIQFADGDVADAELVVAASGRAHRLISDCQGHRYRSYSASQETCLILTSWEDVASPSWSRCIVCQPAFVSDHRRKWLPKVWGLSTQHFPLFVLAEKEFYLGTNLSGFFYRRSAWRRAERIGDKDFRRWEFHRL